MTLSDMSGCLTIVPPPDFEDVSWQRFDGLVLSVVTTQAGGTKVNANVRECYRIIRIIKNGGKFLNIRSDNTFNCFSRQSTVYYHI